MGVLLLSTPPWAFPVNWNRTILSSPRPPTCRSSSWAHRTPPAGRPLPASWPNRPFLGSSRCWVWATRGFGWCRAAVSGRSAGRAFRRVRVLVQSHGFGTLGFYRIRYFIQNSGSSVTLWCGTSVWCTLYDPRILSLLCRLTGVIFLRRSFDWGWSLRLLGQYLFKKDGTALMYSRSLRCLASVTC